MSTRAFTPRLLGEVPTTDLVGVRLTLHFAVQALSAAAYALLPTQPGHEHSTFRWDEASGVLSGRQLPGGNRCFLDITGFAAGVMTAEGRRLVAFDLEGLSLDGTLERTAEALREIGESVPESGLLLPEYDLPDSPLARGVPFSKPNKAQLLELALWFQTGFTVLEKISREHFEGAEVLGWPHHFDVALLGDSGTDGEQSKSVGVGLSPGDESYSEPYYYVSPHPAPDAGALPTAPDGMHWHTTGFTSLILTGSTVVAAGGAGEQAAFAQAALAAAIEAARRLLEE